jgi:serine/threonine protein kinase
MLLKLNILITLTGQACLADFGLCTFVQDSRIQFTPSSSQLQGGTLRFQAPELLDLGGSNVRNTLASDIYAFGCVCYEVVYLHVLLIISTDRVTDLLWTSSVS